MATSSKGEKLNNKFYFDECLYGGCVQNSKAMEFERYLLLLLN